VDGVTGDQGSRMIRIGSVDEPHHVHGGARGEGEKRRVSRSRATLDDLLHP
jgi:hypothetical protein